MKLTAGTKTNLITYGILLLIALSGIFYGRALLNGEYQIRVWNFEDLAFMGLGIPFLFLFGKAGLPDFWDSKLSNKSRLIYPLLIGAVFGLFDILVIKVIQHPQPYTELPPFLQPFPYSLFLYISGAFEIEVFYRLIPFTVLLWIGKTVLEGRYLNQITWIALILTSIREPLEQFPSGDWWYIFYALFTGFLMNFLQAKYFIKYGFLASLFIRLGHYLFWHILLGIYVQWVELAAVI